MHHPLFDIDLAERGQLRELSADQAVATAAAARDGVLTNAQLRALGLSAAAISRRLERRLLFVRHRGVYAVGRLDLTRRGRLRAALLSCGRSAALSHRTAATQWDLLERRERIDITVTGRQRRRPRSAGIDLHHTTAWRPGEVVWRHGLPCTSVARTLGDLAGDADPRPFSRAWNRADRHLLLDVRALRGEVARQRTGCGRVRARLDAYEEPPLTESELEDLVFDLCRAAGLPRPVCQWPLRMGDRTGRVDFVFPGRVAVEADSRDWHATRAAHDADREKDMALREAGFDPHRYTWRQIRDDGPRVAALIARAIADRTRT